MNTLKAHYEEIKNTNYNGVSTKFSGYLQFGTIHTDQNEELGYTSQFIKKCVDIVNSDNYAYSRQKNGYINIYGIDENSPTGVSLIGGIPDELEFLLYALNRTSQLSTTEDLRTARG